MQKQVILHMGFHKTGTSSIQESLGQNANEFLEYNWVYPIFEMDQGTKFNHSVPFYCLFSSKAENYHICRKNRWNLSEVNRCFKAELEKYMKTSHNLIISGEDISLLNEQELTALKQYLEQNKYFIRPIVFIRQPIFLINSIVQQLLRAGDLDIQAILSLLFFRPLETIRKFKRIFNNIEIYGFEEIIHKQDLLSFFLNLLGISNKNFKNIKANESISMPAARLLSMINKNMPLSNSKCNFRQEKDVQYISKIIGEKFTLLRHEIEPYYNTLINNQLEIERECNISFPFFPSINIFPEEYSWSKNSIDSLIEQLPQFNLVTRLKIKDYFNQFHKNNKFAFKLIETI